MSLNLGGFGFLAILAISVAGAPALAQEYKVGQVWHYQTRANEAGSRLYILKIDEAPDGAQIYAISVDGLNIAIPFGAGGVQEVIPHLPVGRETLEASVTKLVTDETAPAMSEANQDGYDTWRSAYDKGEGGWFTVPLADIIQFVEDSLKGQ